MTRLFKFKLATCIALATASFATPSIASPIDIKLPHTNGDDLVSGDQIIENFDSLQGYFLSSAYVEPRGERLVLERGNNQKPIVVELAPLLEEKFKQAFSIESATLDEAGFLTFIINGQVITTNQSIKGADGRDGKDAASLRNVQLINNELFFNLDDNTTLPGVVLPKSVTEINFLEAESKLELTFSDNSNQTVNLAPAEAPVSVESVAVNPATGQLEVKYTDQAAAVEVGEVVSNGIEAIDMDGAGNLVINLTDGTNRQFPIQGEDGKAGVGISEAITNDDNQLVFVLNDEKKTQLPPITMPRGHSGNNGLSIVDVQVVDGVVYFMREDGVPLPEDGIALGGAIPSAAEAVNVAYQDEALKFILADGSEYDFNTVQNPVESVVVADDKLVVRKAGKVETYALNSGSPGSGITDLAVEDDILIVSYADDTKPQQVIPLSVSSAAPESGQSIARGEYNDESKTLNLYTATSDQPSVEIDVKPLYESIQAAQDPCLDVRPYSNLSLCDYSGEARALIERQDDLSHTVFYGAKLSGIDFSEKTLDQTVFYGADLTGATFSREQEESLVTSRTTICPNGMSAQDNDEAPGTCLGAYTAVAQHVERQATKSCYTYKFIGDKAVKVELTGDEKPAECGKS